MWLGAIKKQGRLFIVVVTMAGAKALLVLQHADSLMMAKQNEKDARTTVVNLQFYRQHLLPAPCHNDGDITCAWFSVRGDGTGTSFSRWTEVDIDEFATVTFSGQFDVDLQECNNDKQEDGDCSGIKGTATFQVFNGQGVLTKSKLPIGAFPHYTITSNYTSSGVGTGYFANRKCTFVSEGSLDLFRKPDIEILDWEGSCVLIL